MIAVVNLEVIFLSLNPQKKDLPPVALWSRTATWRGANKIVMDMFKKRNLRMMMDSL